MTPVYDLIRNRLPESLPHRALELHLPARVPAAMFRFLLRTKPRASMQDGSHPIPTLRSSMLDLSVLDRHLILKPPLQTLTLRSRRELRFAGLPPPSPTSRISDSYGTAAVFQIGDVLIGGRYEILQLLGEGGMGAVYKATDRELDRFVALKVIRPELASNPAILARFKQELLLAHQVTHRNVIRIYDLGEAEGVKFITMEFIEGNDLRPSSAGNRNLLPRKRWRSFSRFARPWMRRTARA